MSIRMKYFASNHHSEVSRNAEPRGAVASGGMDEHGHDLMPDLGAHRYFGVFSVVGVHRIPIAHASTRTSEPTMVGRPDRVLG